MKKINHYTVDLPSPKSWDEWFFGMCQQIASHSKCLSRKIGAVIVKDKRVISTGYNGPPVKIQQCDKRWNTCAALRDFALEKTKDNKKMYKEFQYIRPKGKFFNNHLKGKCPRYVPELGFKSGQGLEWCVAGHAERNAIVNAARMGMPALDGCSIYMSCGVPCTPCLIEILNAGIVEVVCTEIAFYSFDKSCKYLLDESKIKIRKYDFLEDEDE